MHTYQITYIAYADNEHRDVIQLDADSEEDARYKLHLMNQYALIVRITKVA